MPVIRVDDEVWAWLKGLAQPFEDTPNSVLRRVAGLEQDAFDDAGSSSPRLRRVGPRSGGKKTPQQAYRAPVLEIIAKAGGNADRAHVLSELERMLRHKLTDFDKQDIKSGTVRWQKSAEWEVSTMRQEGLLLPQKDSPRGVWCLTRNGKAAARDL